MFTYRQQFTFIHFGVIIIIIIINIICTFLIILPKKFSWPKEFSLWLFCALQMQ